MIVVEFIGTPGSGKTSLVPTVIDFLSQQGIHASTVVDAARPFARRTLLGKAVDSLAPASLRGPLLWQVFYHLSKLYRLAFFIKHRQLTRQVLRSQRHRPISADARRHVLYWFFHLVGYYEFLGAHARPDEALVLDEGFIHRVVQMNASDIEEPQPDQILAYIDLLPQPDLVIVPRAPSEVCEKRVFERGVWRRMRHKSPMELSRYVANSDRVVNLAVDYIKWSGWPVIEVNNGNTDLAASIAELRKKLKKSPCLSGEPRILPAAT